MKAIFQMNLECTCKILTGSWTVSRRYPGSSLPRFRRRKRRCCPRIIMIIVIVIVIWPWINQCDLMCSHDPQSSSSFTTTDRQLSALLPLPRQKANRQAEKSSRERTRLDRWRRGTITSAAGILARRDWIWNYILLREHNFKRLIKVMKMPDNLRLWQTWRNLPFGVCVISRRRAR